MTIPYIPGWGDALREGLPQIAEATKRIINPYYDREQALVAEITKDSSVLPKLMEIETNSPGSLEKLYGKGIKKLLASMHLSPTQELAQARVKAAKDLQAANPEAVAEADLKINPAQRQIEQQNAEMGAIALSSQKELFSWLATKPDMNPAVRAHIQKVGGATPAEISDMELGALAEKALQTNTPEKIMEAFLKGEPIKVGDSDVPAASVVQGMFANRSESSKALFEYMMQKSRLEEQIALSREVHRQNRDDLVNIEYTQYIKDTVKTGIKPAAMLVFAHGGDRSVLETLRKAGVSTGSISDEDISKAEEWFSGQQGVNRYKADAGLISLIEAVDKAKGKDAKERATVLASTYMKARYPNSEITMSLDGTITQGGESLDPRGFLAKLRGEKSPPAPSLDNKPKTEQTDLEKAQIAYSKIKSDHSDWSDEQIKAEMKNQGFNIK